MTPMTVVEVFRTIEEVIGTQSERDLLKLLTRDTEMTNEELHTLRGRLIAAKDISRTLRNTLGYDAEAL